MAPKKNGFMTFVFEWKGKYGKSMNMREATSEASKLWEKMTPQERGPYNERAKQDRIGKQNQLDKLTCTGVPVSIVEKQQQEQENKERNMKRQIELTVRNSVKNNALEVNSYYFVMVNYFTKTNGIYVPAEISLVEYSLKEGVNRKYHSYVNPDTIIYGHQYEAQHHADTTHKLPLPPKAMGDKNLGHIYNAILNFVRDKETGDYAPVYTIRDCMPIVESVLDFLKADMDAKKIDLKVYSIQYLFYILKEATCEMGELEKPKSCYITDAFFERDYFEYQTGIACQYHEDMDRNRYCTQSCVTRWGYMFSDYMCRDIAISLIPGRHVPESTNLGAIVNPTPATSIYDDNRSSISGYTASSVRTKPLSEYKIYDDQKSEISDMTLRNYNRRQHNQSVSSSVGPDDDRKPIKYTRHMNNSRKVLESADADSTDDSYITNPWASRSGQTLREPDTSYFNVNASQIYATDESLNRFVNSGCGRGRLFNPQYK